MLRSANEFLVISSNNKTFIPNFVNMAFACELYLKAILQQKTGSYPRGHDLESLYNKVIANINEIDFLMILGEEIGKGFIDIKVSTNVTMAKYQLQQMLNRHKNLFEDWRYIFENPPEKPYSVDGTLRAFAEALKRYSESLID